MAKNKGKFGKGKSDVEETDEFVSGVAKAAERLKPHALRLGFFVGGLAVVLIGYGLWGWYRDEQAGSASAKLHEALAVLEAPIALEDEPAAGDVKQFPSHQARAHAALDQLLGLESEHGKTPVADGAKLLRAATLLELGRPDDAASLYRDYAASGAIPELKIVAKEGVGYALEARAISSDDPTARQTGLEEALAAFRDMQPKQDGPRRDVSLYHQARMLAALDRKQEAIDTYKQVLEVPDTPLSFDVENRLAVLESE